MRRLLFCLGLCLFLAVGCGESPPPGIGGKAPDLAKERTSALLVSLKARQSRVMALCGLASKAAPAFPELARVYLGLALSTAQSLADPQTREMADEARQRALQSGREEQKKELAEIDGLSRAAWPLALVARSALVVDLDLAAKALAIGLERAKSDPDPVTRDRDMAEIAMVMGRIQAPRARELAAGIASDQIRARAWRGLAELTRQPQDLSQAVQADLLISEPGAGAMSLTQTARQAYDWNPEQGLNLFRQAFDLAGKVASPKRRAILQAEVAEALARLDAKAGFDLARRVEPGQGVRFKPLHTVAKVLLASDPVLGRQVMDAAIRAAHKLPLSYERHRALASLAADLAPIDQPAAQALLEQLPKAEYLLRAEAEAAMVLAQAAKDVKQAAVLARAIGDGYVRMGVLARLADIAMPRDPAMGRSLYHEVLSEAARLGTVLPGRALIRAWAALDAETAIRLAGEVSQPVARAQTFVILAKFLHGRGEKAGAGWSLQLALEAINKINVQETLDKVRLLGDMGREWSVIEAGQARKYFALGAEAAKDLG
jgi:hypothetical protein